MTVILDFDPITVTPAAPGLELLLTAVTPLSHHDPAEGDDGGNVTLFNRQKQLLPARVAFALPSQARIDALCAAHPAPPAVAELLRDLSFPEFTAAAILRLWLDLYNFGEGAGIFTGVERYQRLESRAHLAAVHAAGLRGFWDRLCRDLQVGIHPTAADAVLLPLLTLPAGLQQLTLRALAESYRSLVAVARYWSTEQRTVRREGGSEPETLAYDVAKLTTGSEEARVVEVPAVSGNSLRHQVVRAPAWRHLCRFLGLEEARPGRGPVPAGVEALFGNGGNIRAGAKQPNNPFALAAVARERYPVLDLLGGVMDSFDLGESRLKAAGWLVCRENREALIGTAAEALPGADISAFDLLDEVTSTRQAVERLEFADAKAAGQMLTQFQALCAGTQLYVRLALTPDTRGLTAGALAAAVETFLAEMPFVGGQGARGYGRVTGRVLGAADAWAARRSEYEEYLREEREKLRDGLTAGDLGTTYTLLQA